MTVKWADIEADCRGFRQGFVAVFRKYEGQPTDEIDGRGVVYVTESSFARHMGIAVQTFSDWVNPPTRNITNTVKTSSQSQPAPQPAPPASAPGMKPVILPPPPPLPPMPTMASMPPDAQVVFCLAGVKGSLTQLLDEGWVARITEQELLDELRDDLLNELGPLWDKVLAEFGVTR